ncbi:hypothetical protein [Bacillus xiapuensis]|uniref:Uncharacterized protein n=1 Tax=Bacillus xiapuensis TaxID=2014075 RepID=A0ABU6N844_9BACI|nr:hypothetical protein [Bacillus xiapuensis]
MEKQFVIKEAWLLDENGNKLIKLKSINPDKVFQKVNLENIRGGTGKNDLLDNKN